MENLSLPECTLNLRFFGKAVFLDGKCDDGEVFVELPLKLRRVADVIHALVETPGEFRRDGLQRNFLIAIAARMMSSSGGVCGLSVSSIETSVMNLPAPFFADVPVNFPGVLHGGKVFSGHALDIRLRRLKRPGDFRDFQLAGKFRMLFYK
jgi:hypothetical protein